MGRPAYGANYRRARRALLASHPLCAYGCGRPATEADHQPPLALHDHRAGSGCCGLVPSCGPCGRAQGAQLVNGMDVPAPVEVEPSRPEPVGFDVDHECWRVPWLEPLLDVPGNAVWPRLMTVSHPRAVGSLGVEFCAWAEQRTGGRLRWWQRLVAARLLEVDAAGNLVWEAVVLSMARQLGKSWLLRELLFWRVHESARFGGEQLVLHTGKDVAICREVQRPARIWAKARRDEYVVREVNGQEEIAYVGDGFSSRWMIRARDAVYGIAATMVGVDECWKVKAEAVEEGVVPTMVDAEQTQLLLVSTAHRRATSLMMRRRAEALTALATGGGDLLVEWSARSDAELDDRDGWRMASPHWTARRERLIAQRVEAALAGVGDDGDPDEPDPVEAVRAQWLNVWPGRISRPEKGEPVVDPNRWVRARCDDDSAGPLVIAIADHYGRGCAVGFCGTLDDGRLVAGAELVDSRLEAWGLAGRAAWARPGSILVTSASLAADPAAGDVNVDTIVKVGGADTATAVVVIRDLLATGRLVHDGSPAVTAQLREARVNVGARVNLLPGGRHDAVIAVLWAVQAAATRPVVQPAIY